MALELVGGALLSASLQVTFEKLASGEILDYFRKRKLDERLLNKLNIMLLSIDAVVDDAELKQIGNPPVRAWLDAVKDAVLEAEDLLDEIDAQVSKRQLEGESQTCNCKDTKKSVKVVKHNSFGAMEKTDYIIFMSLCSFQI